MGDDTIDHRIVCEEGDGAHFSLALGTDKRVQFVNFFYHLRPAAAWDPRALLLNNDERIPDRLCLAHLAPVGIGQSFQR